MSGRIAYPHNICLLNQSHFRLYTSFINPSIRCSIWIPAQGRQETALFAALNLTCLRAFTHRQIGGLWKNYSVEMYGREHVNMWFLSVRHETACSHLELSCSHFTCSHALRREAAPGSRLKPGMTGGVTYALEKMSFRPALKYKA